MIEDIYTERDLSPSFNTQALIFFVYWYFPILK